MASDFEQAYTSSMDEASYFTLLPQLRVLQQQVREQHGPSALDLIKSLDRECLQVGYLGLNTNPLGQAFLAFPNLMRLEMALIAKIKPENVSEVFQLIAEADYYKPTSLVAQAIKEGYLAQLSGV